MTTYIGIDPGKQGAVAIVSDGKVVVFNTPITHTEDAKGKSVSVYDVEKMVHILETVAIPDTYVALEKCWAFRGEGVTSAFSFGYGNGLWHGIIVALKLKYVLVHPRTWQKELFGCSMKKDEAKSKAVDFVIRTYPNAEIMYGRKGTRIDYGRTDAICIAEYCRRIVK